MTKPALTVIIPTYRRDHYLRVAIRSALGQTRRDIQVVVTDSACSDSTRSLVAEFTDPRLRYRPNPGGNVLSNHVGPVLESEAPFVAYLHDDDVWEPQFVEMLVGPLERHPECVAAFCDQTLIDLDGREMEDETEANRRRWNRHVMKTGVYRPFFHLVACAIPMMMGSVFRRETFDLRKLSIEGSFDLWLSFELARTGGGIYYVRDPLMRYRIHPYQTTASYPDAGSGGAWCCEQMLKDPGMQPHMNVMRRTAAEVFAVAAMQHEHQGKRPAARRYAIRALRVGPSPRNLAILAATLLPAPMSRRLLEARRRLLMPASAIAGGTNGNGHAVVAAAE